MGENKLESEEKTAIQHIQEYWNVLGYRPAAKSVAVEYTGIPFQELGGPKPVIADKKPFIGQTVHYYDHYHHQRAAIVTAIHRDNEEVDLCVLYPTRQDFLLHVKHDADHEKETWDFIR